MGVEVLAIYGSSIMPKIPIRRIGPLSEVQLKGAVARKGTLYDIQLCTSALTAEQAVQTIEQMREDMREKFGITMIHAVATRNGITMIIKGSPFAWAALLLWLPVILALAGVSLLGISVWQIVSEIPSWAWFLLITGGVLLAFGPKMGEWVWKEAEKRR